MSAMTGYIHFTVSNHISGLWGAGRWGSNVRRSEICILNFFAMGKNIGVGAYKFRPLQVLILLDL